MRKMTVLTVAIMLLTLAMVGCVAAAGTSTSSDQVIHASGSGSVTGTPDRVQISFAVQTEEADVVAAQTENAARMNTVINALVAAGVPNDQMKTTGYSIYPVYQDTTNPLGSKVKTYQVTNTLLVTLHDVNQTGTIIDTAVAQGINQVNSIQFSLSDEQAQALRTQALTKAIQAARADADAVAAALGVAITGTETADITQGYTPVVYNSYDMAGAAVAKSAVPTPVQPGDVTVTAQVSVTYGFH
jgi:hypothetical protein